jgi:hypothetical protein
MFPALNKIKKACAKYRFLWFSLKTRDLAYDEYLGNNDLQ